MNKYSILRGKNDWLKNYRGHTFSDKLQNEIIKGVFEEHAKFKYNIPFLKNGIYEQLGKKCLIACVEPDTKELLSVGSSSLLKDESTGIIIDNLILDNFGLWFAGLFRQQSVSGSSVSLKNTAGLNKTVFIYNTSGSVWFGQTDTAFPTGTHIKLGSDSSAVARTDFKIQTSLLTAPESGLLNTNTGAYTAQNTVIYQGDANPTGGTGTVNEAGTQVFWKDNLQDTYSFLITHDVISPGIAFTAGKLLRAAYIWSI